MNILSKFIGDNLFSIVTILALAGWLLFGYVMDERHEAKGTAESVAKEVQIQTIRRELREKKAYEMTDPDSKYSQARQMIIDELEDDLKTLEDKQ